MRRRSFARNLIGTLSMFVVVLAFVVVILLLDNWTWANFSAH
ncbi:MAG: hypothetical protein WCB85_02085 [Candidatus Dormiibacterota bacterium]|jgi:hypothetical protein